MTHGGFFTAKTFRLELPVNSEYIHAADASLIIIMGMRILHNNQCRDGADMRGDVHNLKDVVKKGSIIYYHCTRDFLLAIPTSPFYTKSWPLVLR